MKHVVTSMKKTQPYTPIIKEKDMNLPLVKKKKK